MSYNAGSAKERSRATEKIKNPEVTRFKGLGEINPKEFKQFISGDIRLTPVQVQSMGTAHKTLEFFMGKNTPVRKKFIIDNLKSEVVLSEL